MENSDVNKSLDQFTMSLAAFKASRESAVMGREWCEQWGDGREKQAVFEYEGPCLTVCRDDGQFSLTIGRDEWVTSDLPCLEEILYSQWYLREIAGVEVGYALAEIVLKGFDGGTDVTDHLVLTVKIPQLSADPVSDLRNSLESRDVWQYVEGASLIDVPLDYAAVDFELPMRMDALVGHIKALGVMPILTAVEKQHAESNTDNAYGEEIIIPLANGREIRTPAGDAVASYVRITHSGKELAYWVSDEWRDDPECVMGAILGAARGQVKTQ